MLFLEIFCFKIKEDQLILFLFYEIYFMNVNLLNLDESQIYRIENRVTIRFYDTYINEVRKLCEEKWNKEGEKFTESVDGEGHVVFTLTRYNKKVNRYVSSHGARQNNTLKYEGSVCYELVKSLWGDDFIKHLPSACKHLNYKDYEVTAKHEAENIINKFGLKQGVWDVIYHDETYKRIRRKASSLCGIKANAADRWNPADFFLVKEDVVKRLLAMKSLEAFNNEINKFVNYNKSNYDIIPVSLKKSCQESRMGSHSFNSCLRYHGLNPYVNHSLKVTEELVKEGLECLKDLKSDKVKVFITSKSQDKDLNSIVTSITEVLKKKPKNIVMWSALPSLVELINHNPTEFFGYAYNTCKSRTLYSSSYVLEANDNSSSIVTPLKQMVIRGDVKLYLDGINGGIIYIKCNNKCMQFRNKGGMVFEIDSMPSKQYTLSIPFKSIKSKPSKTSKL